VYAYLSNPLDFTGQYDNSYIRKPTLFASWYFNTIMAEPISLAASVIEVTNTGFALGKFLNETWLSYKNAPAEVLEIAHDVTICCELMTPLGEQLKTGSAYYTSRFQEAVEGLVKNASLGPSSL
jgi:hypothetical protein